MIDRVEELLDRYLDLRLRGEDVEIGRFLSDHPELEEGERERFRRLAELIASQPDGSAGNLVHDSPARARVGSYRILRELGRGGQGAVFLAEDTRFARKVALKVLTRHGLELRDDPRGRESFARLRREAEVVSRLDHPGICVVYEMGTELNDLYIAMRYVEGETLAKKIAAARADHDPEGPSRARNACRIALPVSGEPPPEAGTPPSSGRRDIERILALVERSARALHVAHEAGVIHRDVKPGNIMVTPEGEPVLLDFGLASDVKHSATALTVSGGLLGTPAYMSPEHFSAAHGPVDRRADVYSLGVTLFECLTLERPFQAPTLARLYRDILTEPPPDARRFNASIPRDLVVVLEVALEKDVDHRYQTALDLAEDLRRVRVHEPIRARPAGIPKRCARWTQRNPGLGAALAGVFLALTTGLAVSLYLLGREREALGRERVARTEAEGKDLLAESGAVLATNPCLALLLAIEGAQAAPGLNANNALLQAIGELRERRMLETHTQMTQCLRSPDGRFLVTTSRDGLARVWDADTWSLVRALAGHTGEVGNALFSPDGSLLATAANDGTCRLWSTTTWSTVHVLRESYASAVVVGFDSGGRRLLTRSGNQQGIVTTLWDVARGTALHVLPAGTTAVVDVEFSRGGRILVVDPTRGVRVWDVDAETPRLVLEISNSTPGQGLRATFSPSGEQILVEWQERAALRDVETDEELWSLDSEGRGLGPLAFRADGQRVLVGHADDAGIRDAASGRPICELEGASPARGHASFSPDGTQLLAGSADGGARLWDAGTGRELATFQGGEAQIEGAEFSLSGRTAITASFDGEVREWWLASEGQRSTFSAGPGQYWLAGFDAAGKRVAAVAEDGAVRVIELDPLATPSGFEIPGLHDTRSLALAPDGRSLLTVMQAGPPSPELEGKAGAWDVETGTVLATFQHPQGVHVYDAQFSPDGQLVVTAADDGRARIWQAHTGQSERELVGHLRGVRSAAFGLDGRRIVTASEDLGDACVRVWDTESGAELAVLRADGEQPIRACLSPDGRRALAACWRGKACLWDVASRALIRCWQAHSSHLSSAVFSPDGTRILTASDDGAHLWDAETREQVLTIDERRNETLGASFSADGRWIVTASSRGARIWPVDALQRARKLAPRELTLRERERFFRAPK